MLVVLLREGAGGRWEQEEGERERRETQAEAEQRVTKAGFVMLNSSPLFLQATIV